jgi:predicted  nucleic acid-binding Zn-ribbon protein
MALSPVLKLLLVLQDRDTRRADLGARLGAVPGDIALVEEAIASERAALESARNEIRELEAGKKLIENEIGSAQEKLSRYRVQQLSVRKNDEYQALGREIEGLQSAIGDQEGRELEIMYAIDEARRRLAVAETTARENVGGHEAKIRALRESEVSLGAELKAAEAATAEARIPVPPPVLRVYDRLAARSLPAVVPINGSKCGGCHLKVSSETESAARGKNPNAELAACDQCGRIVFWEG